MKRITNFINRILSMIKTEKPVEQTKQVEEKTNAHPTTEVTKPKRGRKPKQV